MTLNLLSYMSPWVKYLVKYLWTLQARIWRQDVLGVLSYVQMFFLTAYKIIKKKPKTSHQKPNPHNNKKKKNSKQTNKTKKKPQNQTKTKNFKNPPPLLWFSKKELMISEELTYFIRNFVKTVYFSQKHLWEMTVCSCWMCSEYCWKWNL